MKHMKKVFVVLTVAMTLAAPVSVFAANPQSGVNTNFRGTCGLGINASTLTEEQKAAQDAYCDQVMEAKKESINNMVKYGLLTQEQGNLALERINAMEAYHEENGYGVGMMNGTGNCEYSTENAEHGRGMMGERH